MKVGTVHLESLEHNAEIRENQLDTIFEIFQAMDSAREEKSSFLLMGDFNFGSNWPENTKIKTSYVDLWPYLHPNDPGIVLLTPEKSHLSFHVFTFLHL